MRGAAELGVDLGRVRDGTEYDHNTLCEIVKELMKIKREDCDEHLGLILFYFYLKQNKNLSFFILHTNPSSASLPSSCSLHHHLIYSSERVMHIALRNNQGSLYYI